MPFKAKHCNNWSCVRQCSNCFPLFLCPVKPSTAITGRVADSALIVSPLFLCPVKPNTAVTGRVADSALIVFPCFYAL